MRVAISAAGPDIEAGFDPRFGRTPYFLIVQTETMKYEAIPNPNINIMGSSGIQAARFIGNMGAEAVITGQVGPNAFQTLSVIGVRIYQGMGRTVRQAVEAFKAGRLPLVTQPGPAYAGIDGAIPQGFPNRGRGSGRRGAGAGFGRGRGGLPGQGFAPWQGGMTFSPEQVPFPPYRQPVKTEIEALRQQADLLEKQLKEIVKRLQDLEATDQDR
jgi:predicted Fe-Mo cluster-binding NifX family protein